MHHTKYHPIWNHRTTRPIYLKATKKDMENSKYQRTETVRGCAGTTNQGITQKPDNNLKGTRNPIPLNPDILLKGIRNLVQNGIQRQWTRALTVPA